LGLLALAPEEEASAKRNHQGKNRPSGPGGYRVQWRAITIPGADDANGAYAAGGAANRPLPGWRSSSW
jgi:hypothetical protein